MFAKILDTFLQNKILLWFLVIANIAGTLFGFYYYQVQFAATPLYLWPFVPDSPLATLFFAAALSYYALKRKFHPLLTIFAFFSLAKVGIWTLLVIPAYGFFFLTSLNIAYYSLLFVLHGGMVLEGLVLRKGLIGIRNQIPVFISTVWFFLNDASDYFLGTVPVPVGTLGREDLLALMGVESFVATILIGLFLWKRYRS